MSHLIGVNGLILQVLAVTLDYSGTCSALGPLAKRVSHPIGVNGLVRQALAVTRDFSWICSALGLLAKRMGHRIGVNGLVLQTMAAMPDHSCRTDRVDPLCTRTPAKTGGGLCRRKWSRAPGSDRSSAKEDQRSKHPDPTCNT